MLNLYERIDALCKSKKTTISAMCKELSINRSTLSELSSGRTKSLSTANINKIADYQTTTFIEIIGLY